LRLDFFQESLFGCASEFGWDLRAWAVLANHYHFIAASPSDPGTLRKFLGKLHKLSAKHLDAYLDELEHRFNNRNNEFLFRNTLLKLVKAEKLPYSELTKAA
jgi:REP element-mobilizing transposase RayT